MGKSKGTKSKGKATWSKEGKQYAEKMMKESEDRDPDMRDLYIYNDYMGYGLVEVLENAVKELKKHLTAKKYKAALSVVEGVLIWQDQDGVDEWAHIDDGDRTIAMHHLLLAGIINTLHHLMTEDLDHARATALKAAEAAISVAENSDIELDDELKVLEDIKEALEGEAEEAPKVPKSDFNKLYTSYSKLYDMGGTKFDLSKDDPEELQKRYGLHEDRAEDQAAARAGIADHIMALVASKLGEVDREGVAAALQELLD
eukprot:CAMPEP_0202915254 /NCGR_PEP_ID=MMETSP1392-20130828/65190_1 /ASSEMBLY_ACC=CAM_ASM_000868 /TAXON_ID=225041 /ORGANISM="Chlamydomonas chlamydogama, Strain SAG 11-48b" /LENGTH=257 /DNA_ID=CAMNT_0049607193 /DNA_START=85 /DNA_END=855 /DNA_ORIENTATION=+